MKREERSSSRGQAISEHFFTERERTILRLLVDRFVSTGEPVGSSALSKSYDLGLSPASIRSTMSDLEELGCLGHPHTSAGRVPTDYGYRVYVDELMHVQPLNRRERRLLAERVAESRSDIEDLIRESARLLGQLSNLLGVVLSPRFASAVLRRLDILPVASNKAMFVVTVESGLVKTLVLEVETELNEENVAAVATLLNERLAGLTFEEIRSSFGTRVVDIAETDADLINFVLERAGLIFSDLPHHKRLRYSGAEYIVLQPEFSAPEAVRHMISVLENGDAVVSVLEEMPDSDYPNEVAVRIGHENPAKDLSDYSVVTMQYKVGNVSGSVGVIGPTRMNYSRVVGLVNDVARTLNHTIV
ncbi:MAG: heat-inducible transcriptional repressor HrcA [Rhodothermales bacterium]